MLSSSCWLNALAALGPTTVVTNAMLVLAKACRRLSNENEATASGRRRMERTRMVLAGRTTNLWSDRFVLGTPSGRTRMLSLTLGFAIQLREDVRSGRANVPL